MSQRTGSNSLQAFNLNSFEVVSRHLAGLAVGYQFELNLLAFVQRGHAGALYSRNMDKSVLGTIFRLDKAEPFGGIEEFYGTDSH